MDQLIRDMVRQSSAERAVIELFVAIDRRDWSRVRRLLAEQVDVHLSSVDGSEGVVDADDLVASWRTGLAGLTAVHHQIGNLRSTVHEDEGHVACHAIAYHYRPQVAGDDVRRFVGVYDVGLRDTPRGWSIHTFRFDLRFMDGNPDLT